MNGILLPYFWVMKWLFPYFRVMKQLLFPLFWQQANDDPYLCRHFASLGTWCAKLYELFFLIKAMVARWPFPDCYTSTLPFVTSVLTISCLPSEVWTPYIRGSTPFPRPNFTSLPPPPFFPLFVRVPPPKIPMFCPRPPSIWPPPPTQFSSEAPCWWLNALVNAIISYNNGTGPQDVQRRVIIVTMP